MTFNIKESLLDISQQNPDEEICGLVLDNGSLVTCENLSSDPRNSFILDPAKLVYYEDRLVGVFHTHPKHESALPSFTDLQSSLFSNEIQFYVSNGLDVFKYWFNDKLKVVSYEKIWKS